MTSETMQKIQAIQNELIDSLAPVTAHSTSITYVMRETLREALKAYTGALVAKEILQ